MRGGVRIFQDPTITSVDQPSGMMNYYQHHHPSDVLAYGVDWMYPSEIKSGEVDRTTDWIGSCSFYDHQMHFWKFSKRNAAVAEEEDK